MVRAIECASCKKQRWAPQVPEAMHGWRHPYLNMWLCPDCTEPVYARTIPVVTSAVEGEVVSLDD